MSYVEVRQLGPADWAAYKDVRLRALQESPDSFCATFEQESEYSDEKWSERLGVGDGASPAILVAELDKTVVGLICGVLPTSADGDATICQMWVDPEFRGNGVGKLLLARIIHWAMNAEVKGLELGVTTTNTDAVSLYELAGFMSVGEPVPLREGSALSVTNMRIEFDVIEN